MNNKTARRTKLIRKDAKEKVKIGGEFNQVRKELLAAHASRIESGQNNTRYAYKGI